MQASVLDLRKNMKKVISAISRNEKVILTRRGKRTAVIVPFSSDDAKKAKTSSHPAFGMWSDKAEIQDVAGYVRSLRKPRSF